MSHTPSPSSRKQPSDFAWRTWLHEVIFEADTPAGKAFDIVLIGSILVSVLIVMLESVASIRATYGPLLHRLEWMFTGLFTVEFLLRLVSVRKPWRYVLSFFGFVDLLSLLPTYLSWVLPGGQYLFTIRILRLLRVFRVLKLTEYLSEAQVLREALRASRRKISVFILTVMALVVIIGSLMYLIEGEQNGFDDIPESIYWAIVTLTTVGYGDISPQTPAGKMLASVVMVLGYGIIAVPTGIVTAELARSARTSPLHTTQACQGCGGEGHEADARYCKYCGSAL